MERVRPAGAYKKRAVMGVALLLSATTSACGVSGDLASSPRAPQVAQPAEFSVFATYPTESDEPRDPELAAHLNDVLGPDAQIRYITNLSGSLVYMARGDMQLCIASEGKYLSASCGAISTPPETWVATASAGPGMTPYLLVAAPDGYTDGHIGEQTCRILSNMLIVLKPNLQDSVRLTGDGMVEAVFEGQALEPLPGEDDLHTNDCFPT